MSKGGRLILAAAALAGGVALAQSVPGTGSKTRFDPFNPQLSLNAPADAAPATQPTIAEPTTKPSSTGTAGPGRPVIRDPFHPPTRSPFRP